MPRVLAFPEGETPPDLRAQVRAMQDEAWPDADAVPGAGPDLAPWHDPALRPTSLLLVDDDGSVLSALDLLFATVVHAGRGYAAVGLSAVVTPVSRRGQGHGRTLVTHARESLPGLGVDLALFTCDRPLAGFYASCGWELLPGTVLVGGTAQDPFPSDAPGFDKVTFGAFVTPSAVAAHDSFVGARVLLHCGSIDRLW